MTFLPLALAVSGFLAVALGAFGAHGLQAKLDDHHMKIFQTAVQYHFYHTLALGLCMLFLRQNPETLAFARAGLFFTIGIAVFSGSLYALAITGMSKLGMITPIGGLCFLIGWILLGLGFWRTMAR